MDQINMHKNLASKGKKKTTQWYLWSVNIADLHSRSTEGSGDEDQACDRCAVITPKQCDVSLDTKSLRSKERRRTSREKQTWATNTEKTSGGKTPGSSFDQSGPVAQRAVGDLQNKTSLKASFWI